MRRIHYGYGALTLVLALLATWAVHAWESHPVSDEEDNPVLDENGDMRFGSEHVTLTAAAMDAVNAFQFMGTDPPDAIDVCSEVRDFNSVELGWDTLRTRTFCPTSFAELPDFSYSMEDYINQHRACPPADRELEWMWDYGDCHSFEHFMGALNSSHFPPQTRLNYQRYHQIAQAVLALGNTLHGQLFVADALGDYGSYFEECRLEALTYESIAQHYLQDQWAMGHMWHRWGGPDLADFEPTGPFAPFRDWPNAQLVYGQVIGGVSGMIHGWKSTVRGVFGEDHYMSNDAMSYYTEGVDWVRLDLPGVNPGVGDLFLPDMQDERFATQRREAEACYQESVRQVIGFNEPQTEISPLCWSNYATNRAMDIGLNWSPSAIVSVILLVTSNLNIAGEPLNTVIDGANLELLRLSTIFASAAWWHPEATYLAEGYTSINRTRRLNLFSIGPNDEYARVPEYMDPARDAPGDPVGFDAVLPDDTLFGERQVKYFNRCHTQLYCDDPEILNHYRDRCREVEDGSREAECQICEDLAARFYVGDPPICEILAPESDPDPSNDNPPDTASEVRQWCRPEEEVEPCGHPIEGVWAGVMSVVQGTDAVSFGTQTMVDCGDLVVSVDRSAGGDCLSGDFNEHTVCFIGMEWLEKSFKGCADTMIPPWSGSFLEGSNDVMAEYNSYTTFAEFSVWDRLSVITKETDEFGETVVSAGLLGRCDDAVLGSCWEAGRNVCTEYGAGNSDQRIYCRSVLEGTWFPTPCPGGTTVGRCVRGEGDATSTTIYYAPLVAPDPATVCADGVWETP